MQRAQEALVGLQERLARAHGVCRIEVDLVPDAQARAVRIEGAVLVDRLRAPVVTAVQAELPPGWTAHESLRVVQGGPWFSLPDRRPLFASASGGAVVTLLHPEDGPLELLGEHAGARLVRDRCGTAGWTQEALGPAIEAPALPRPWGADPAQLVAAAQRFIGTPYRLGGTDPAFIDCSGLVQRAAWSTLGVALPRNTGDLWGLGAVEGARPPPGLGHLVFVWTHGESLRHVGIIGEGTVVHASLSRRVVVQDPRARFYASAERIDHIPFDALLALGRRAAGRPNLLAAGVRLGQVPPSPGVAAGAAGSAGAAGAAGLGARGETKEPRQ